MIIGERVTILLVDVDGKCCGLENMDMVYMHTLCMILIWANYMYVKQKHTYIIYVYIYVIWTI